MGTRLPRYWLAGVLLLAAALLSGCGGRAEGVGGTEGRVKVVATTTMVADVVRQVGGELIELRVLLPNEADPHTFEAAPRDMAAVADADVVFANGAGLETFMEDLLENAGGEAAMVYVSEGIDFISLEEGDEEESDEEGHAKEEVDPHVWFAPGNVMVWVENIAAALIAQDEENAAVYRRNAEDYIESLVALDAWIWEQVGELDAAERVLVSDHRVFGYFGREYGFEQVGAVIPGYSTLAAPSAEELAALEDAMQAYGTKAILVGNTVSPSLAQRVASDTGVRLVFVYTGSLSGADGPAATYVDFMRFNVTAMVEALR